jgi:hypothetical protein
MIAPKRVLFFDDGEHNHKMFQETAPEVVRFLVRQPGAGQDGGGVLDQNSVKGGMFLRTIDDIADFAWNPGDVLLFDWDLTLSAYNGLQLPSPDVEAAAVHYAGGVVRLEHLKRMFRSLRKKKVKFFILTDNPTAMLLPQRRHFLKLLHEFDPKFLLSELVYGHQQKAVVYRTNREIVKAVQPVLAKKKRPQFTRRLK